VKLFGFDFTNGRNMYVDSNVRTYHEAVRVKERQVHFHK